MDNNNEKIKWLNIDNPFIPKRRLAYLKSHRHDDAQNKCAYVLLK